jgi:hypothetical protein
MRARSHGAWLILVAAPALGCAPTLTQLVADKHYREAICAGVDGYEEEAGLVADALVADADVQLHVHRITASELAPVLGEATADVAARVELVRVRLATNALPVDGYDIRMGVVEHADRYPAAPAGWESLVYATGERLPPNRTASTYATPENALKGLGAFFTVGISLLFTGGFEPSVYRTEPYREDYLAVAPLATALHDAFGASGCGGDPLSQSRYQGRTCTAFFVLPSHDDARWRLVVEQTFGANRLPADLPEEEARCAVTHAAAVDLSGASTLRAHTRRVFGPRMRPLATLAE